VKTDNFIETLQVSKIYDSLNTVYHQSIITSIES